jgi:hypothetical protein
MATAFALVAALLAALTMGALETKLLDETAYALGVGIAAIVGFVVAHIARRRGALAVVIAGAMVGMAIQAVLLVRLPSTRTYFMTEWVTTKDPISWILIGAPLGVLPAIGAAFLFFLGMQMSRTAGRPAPKDAPERVLVPIAGAAAVLAGFGVGQAHAGELVVVLIVLAVSCGALLQVARIDRARMRWLRDVFDARDPSFGVMQLDGAYAADLPLVVGGLEPKTVVTHVTQLGTYRSSPSVRYGLAGFDFEATVRPLARRIRIALALAASGSVCAVLAAMARH